MKIEDVKALRRGDSLYCVEDAGDQPRLVEWRLDSAQLTPYQMRGGAGSFGRPKTVYLRRAKFRGERLSDGEGAVRRVSVSDLLADFDKTPGEAAALYVQTKVRAELQAQAKLSATVASLVSAREWFAAWHASERKVW